MKKTFKFQVKQTSQDARGERVRFEEIEGQDGVTPAVGLRSASPSGFAVGQVVRVTIETEG